MKEPLLHNFVVTYW